MDMIKIVLKFIFALDLLLLLYLVSIGIYLVTAVFPNITLNIIRKVSALVILFITLVKGFSYSFKLTLLLNNKFPVDFLLNFYMNSGDECAFYFKWGAVYAFFLLIALAIFIKEIVTWKYIKKNGMKNGMKK